MIGLMDPQVLHITEADLARDVRAILQRVETRAEIVIEPDAQPVALLCSAVPRRRKISAAHGKENQWTEAWEKDLKKFSARVLEAK